MIGRLVDRGAAGVVLGCTEIELLVGQEHVGVPVFPTTRLHAVAAVDLALTPLDVGLSPWRLGRTALPTPPTPT